MPVKLWLSDHAWEHLSNIANSYGWIRQLNTTSVPGYTTRGIGRFFDALSNCVFYDTRPTHLDSTCVWYEGDNGHVRLVTVSYYAIVRLAVVAVNNSIPPRWYALNVFCERVRADPNPEQYAEIVAHERTTLACLAAVTLEAVGCRFLTPGVFPAAPANLFRRKSRARVLATEQRILNKLGFGA